MRWPLWAKIYAVIVGAPMVGVSLALMLYIVLVGFGDALQANTLGRLLISVVYAEAFLTTAWLFFMAVRRIVLDKHEALLYAATGHLLLAMPAAMFAVVSFLRLPNTFINNLTSTFDDGVLYQSGRLLLWVAFHTYLALVLSMSDRTSPH